MTQPNAFAIRAKTIIPLIREQAARGKDLYTKLPRIDNGVVLVMNGRVADIGKASQVAIPQGWECQEVDGTLIPGVINCHTHLELVHCANKTRSGQGFSAWLQSLIDQKPRSMPEDANYVKNLSQEIADLVAQGTAFVGSILTPNPSLLVLVPDIARCKGLGLHVFAECFGFGNSLPPLPPPEHQASLAGHSLYSTNLTLLQRAALYCQQHKAPFSLHLAESLDEEAMLAHGQGPLLDIFQRTILPKNWVPPFQRPLALAKALGLLTSNLLAVHCVHLTDAEIQVLGAHRCAVCLCPRSNAYIGVGEANVRALLKEQVLVCLGTDGLSSNTDLNVINEALYLKERYDIPNDALIRMLTVNASQALHCPKGYASLGTGARAVFCKLPHALTDHSY